MVNGGTALPAVEVLDLEHLSHYTAGDPGLQSELLGLFAEQLTKHVEVLTSGATGQDWMVATHTLKGAARAVGAWDVAKSAEELEEMDPVEQAAACAKVLNALLGRVDTCKAAIAHVCEAA